MKSSLNDNFCSSPWFHIRIDPQGNYLPCRWSNNLTPGDHNISNTTISEYVNSPVMRDLRTTLLAGDRPEMCSACHYEDEQNKVSGRQKQLLKSAVTVERFDRSFCSSPHWPLFEHSYNNQGHTDYQPADLQIDLGNTCNSSCIMCFPGYSSRLATDYVTLNQINPQLFPIQPIKANWADDEELVEKFVAEISQNPNIKYIHFLGGETLYLKSFYSICNKLIELGYSQQVSIGTTTNCTVYSSELERIIKEFKHVHLGLSIESGHELNDYIRWPSDIVQIKDNINKFIKLREQTGLQLALRITPNVFSIYHIDTIFEMMIANDITAESCNILHAPSCLRVELLPKDLAEQALVKINKLINQYQITSTTSPIINRRSLDLVKPVIADGIFEYKHLLETYQHPNNLEEERHNMVAFIKAFESMRGNSILTYLPEYEEFLRSYGY